MRKSQGFLRNIPYFKIPLSAVGYVFFNVISTTGPPGLKGGMGPITFITSIGRYCGMPVEVVVTVVVDVEVVVTVEVVPLQAVNPAARINMASKTINNFISLPLPHS